ncbi:uncharacterized protein [Littorina saxatilis]|uniref:Protein kinase domain-containing protein n=1 Tax=Littorina saxatilis TaxID=31220 RepID=A0AAN9BPN2_9CAEN
MVLALSARGSLSDHEASMSSDLLTAAKNGYYNQVVSLLSNHPCDVNSRDKDKATPLYWSASRGHCKICVILIQAGCDVNACVKWGSTALHAAADRGHVDCLTLLIESNAQVNVQNERGDTALHLAAYRGFKDIVQVLVNAWADPFVKNGQSKTPLQEAQSQQHGAAATVLQKYMEALGCHPFNSLPESKSRSQSSQDQPSFSVPTASWPRYQSFPKLHDNIPPTELARPQTFPINNVNNLSGGSGSRPLSGNLGVVRENGLFRDGTAFGELSVAEGARNPAGVDKHKVNSLRHVHLDPEEHSDDSFNHVAGAAHCHNGGAGAGGGVGGAGRGHAVNSPVHHQNHSRALYQNGQGRAMSQGDVDSVTSFLPPPDMAPPHPQGSSSLVKHEDLTQFAESLQLEVVKLREELADRERQVAQLQTTLASLTAHNAHLHKLVATDVSTRTVSQDALAVKELQLSELREKVFNVEKQNACLQQALAQEQARSHEHSAHRDEEVCELTANAKGLERLNSSLQQLIVTQQDTMKGMLASKDAEIAQLKDRLESVCREVTPVKGATKRHGAHAESATSERTLPSSGSSGARGDPSLLAFGQAGVPPTETHTARFDAQSAVSSGSASVGTSTAAPRSVISFCDQSARQSQQCTLPTQAHAKVFSAHETSSIPRTTTSTPASSDLTPASSRESQQAWLRASVSRLYQEQADTGKLDADGREWTVGKEFQLLDSRPVNCASDGQRSGSCSLVFSIGHRGRKYMLKMLMNLINLSYEAHSLGRSLDAHLLHRFGAEFHAPLLLHPHPNIVRVRHHYQGDTTHFRAYLPLLVPASLDVPVEMARRTTFLVMDQYPQTLGSFLQQAPIHPQLPEQFLLQVLYQLLSALVYLQTHHVVHRDIKADNVFLDWRLRPVLGDFGFARTLRGYGGQTVPFSDHDQVFAGNPHAWAPELSRWSRCDPATLPQPMSLEDVYSKADGFAVARMFYHLVGADNSSNKSGSSFPTSTQNQPHYPDSAIPALPHPVSPALGKVLKSLVLDDPSRRPTTRQALCRVGVLLCKPTTALTSPQAADEFFTSQLLRLSSQQAERPTPREDGKTLSLAESVAANQNHCLADFLLSFSSNDLWEAYNGTRTGD